jgi:excisionase family DNA binding protein
MTGSLLTTRQVAEYLCVSPETILRRVRAGEIPAYRIATNALRFRESDIDAWLEARQSRLHQHVRSVGRVSGSATRSCR